MRDIFFGREEMAQATTALFKSGFYLRNVGFALYILKIYNALTGMQDTIEVLSSKIGGFPFTWESSMQPLKRLVKSGLGGRQANGKQMFSWVPIDDLFQIILFLRERRELNGVLNCSSPAPVSNKSLMKSIRDALHVKIGLPAPAWLLKNGAVVIRTETE